MPQVGLEPTRLATSEPKSDMSTNFIIEAIWCLQLGLNQRHADFQSAALPTELYKHFNMAGKEGLEPPTLGFGIRCSIQLELFTYFLVRVVRVELTISSAQTKRITINPLPIYGGCTWTWTRNAEGAEFTAQWGYQFSYTPNYIILIYYTVNDKTRFSLALRKRIFKFSFSRLLPVGKYSFKIPL